MNRSTPVATLVGLLAIALGVMAAMAAARPITRVIEGLTATAAAFAAGNLDQRARPGGPVKLQRRRRAILHLSSRRGVQFFLPLLLLAEAVTLVGTAWLGLIVQAGLLLGLAAFSASAKNALEGKLLAGLMLVPLLRIVAMSMPLFRFPELLWQGSVAVPVLFAAFVAIRRLNLPTHAVGLGGRLWREVPLSGMGLGIGALAYAALPHTSPAIVDLWLLLAACIALLLAGFGAELVFRGVLLALARPVLGSASVVFTALIYAALQIGHGSAANLAFAFGVGLLFAYLATRRRSIIGISLAHGVANLMLFLVLPQVPFADITWLVLGGTAIGLVALRWASSVPAPPSVRRASS